MNDYEGVTVAGIAIVAADTGRVFLAQRAFDETDDPEVQETWEFPGGHLKQGEDPFVGASREFAEEIGLDLPEGEVTGGWRSEDGHYQAFVYEVPVAFGLDEFVPNDEVSMVGWFTREQVEELEDLRPEVRDQTDWGMNFGVSGNTEQGAQMDEAEQYADIDLLPIPVHGVVAPEETPTGDRRGFAAGSMTRRPLRLPLRDTATDIGAHGGAYVVGSVDRLMRADGLIHWEGLLMPTAAADGLAEKMQFFDGRYGVSVDGDQGNADIERTQKESVLWFDQIRAAGLTAVDIPAFHEAYVAFGHHPGMPDENDHITASAMIARHELIGGRVTFDRGPGWITNPRETKNIHDYWTRKGEEGYAKIRWGTPGDFTRAKRLIGAKIAKHSPEKMKYLNQIIAQWHFDALGYWPGDLGKPGNAPDTPENRRRAARHAAASDGTERMAHLKLVSQVESEAIEAVEESDESVAEWEAVLVSSAGTRVLPPLDYFHQHPSTDAQVVEEPDKHGLRRVHGYAAQWGVCHIGMNGVCVEPPRTYSNDYPDFHLGRTKTRDGYVYTGVLTYGVDHRDAETILSEEPTKAYFDNLNNAWAAVRVGEDDIGIWYSGVVLPGVPEDDLVKIEATGQVSGEWLHGEMRACLTVNIAGFPVQRASAEYDEQGNVVALAASAFNVADCPPTPAERMAAIRFIDAEIRFAALREQWLREQSA